MELNSVKQKQDQRKRKSYLKNYLSYYKTNNF